MLIRDPVKMSELARDLCTLPKPAAETKITGLAADSRSVRPGFLFAALPGSEHDGNAFIPHAIARGAKCLLTREHAELPQAAETIPAFGDKEPARLFSHLSARFHQTQPDYIAAITGTNGKSSTASFLRHIWEQSGHRAASIGTLGIETGALHCPASLTTPSADYLYRLLSVLGRRNFNHVALEASSHGLAQHRLDGVRLSAAAFTYLGHDHLDYHADKEAYLAAKLRLVDEVLPATGRLVLHEGAAGADQFAAIAAKRGIDVLTLGKGAALDIHDIRPASGKEGQVIQLRYESEAYEIEFPLPARFQAINALMAAALAICCGAKADAVFPLLETMPPVAGRLEKVGTLNTGQPVFIDYAHTPDALEAVLHALAEQIGEGQKIALLFGCGGERDSAKRARMGEIANRLAARVVITDDNPRKEDAAKIRADILAACPEAEEIAGRDKAIPHLLDSLAQDEVALIAGRGHETMQHLASGSIPFSDKTHVLAWLKKEGA